MEDPQRVETGRTRLSQVILVFGACASALLSNTPAAFNFIQQRFQNDLNASDIFTEVMMGLGVAFIQLVLIQGRLLDAYGPVVVTLFCGAFAVVGYGLMSWTDSQALMFLEYLMVSFGSGGTFLAALSVVIALQNTLGIALVSLAMSISLSVTVQIATVYANVADCNEDYCWRNIVRVYAIFLLGAFIIAAICISLFKWLTRVQQSLERDSRYISHASINSGPMKSSDLGSDYFFYDESEESGSDHRSNVVSYNSRGINPSGTEPLLTPQIPKSSSSAFHDFAKGPPPIAAARPNKQPSAQKAGFLDSLAVLKTKFWWSIFVANMLGISSGVFLITQAFQIFNEYVGSDDAEDDAWRNQILNVFSYWNAFVNVASPMFADFLLKRKLASRKTYLGLCLIAVAIDFGLLILLYYLPDHDQSGNKTTQVIFMALLATAFGTFVVLVPQIIGATYPPANFGTYISYMQVGSATWGAIVPFLAGSIKELAGSYVYVYMFFGISCLISGFSLFRVHSPVAPLDATLSPTSPQIQPTSPPLSNGIQGSSPLKPSSRNPNREQKGSTDPDTEEPVATPYVTLQDQTADDDI